MSFKLELCIRAVLMFVPLVLTFHLRSCTDLVYGTFVQHRRRLEGKQRKVDIAEKQRLRRVPRKQRPAEIKERDVR